MTNTPKSEYEQIQFDGRTVCVLSPEDVEALELGIQKQAEEIEKLKAELETVKANDRFRTELSVKNSIITKRRLFEVMQKECPEDGEEVDKISEETLIEAIESYIWDMRVELITKKDELKEEVEKLKAEVDSREKRLETYRKLTVLSTKAMQNCGDDKASLELELDRRKIENDTLQSRFDWLLKELEDAWKNSKDGEVLFGKLQSIIKQARGE